MHRKKALVLATITTIVAIAAGCHKAQPFDENAYDERLSGGSSTVFDESSRAFTNAIPGLSSWDTHIHELGDGAFEQTFVAAPAPVAGGLGPIFNNVSCISCHHNDGKGTPTAGAVNSSMLFRVSMPGFDHLGVPNLVSGYGGQLQDRAVFGKQAEASIQISYEALPVTYADGAVVNLRKPSYSIAQSYIPMATGHLLSPRLAPPVFGLGLLELIPEATLLGFADENDADKDGISGRPNYVYNAETKRTEIGRFGLKASVPTINVQVASAYNQDMGVTNRIFPIESSYGQPQLDALNDDPELADSLLTAVSFYIKTLAVPARRRVADPAVVKGQQLFAQLACASCHKPTVQTEVDSRFSALSNQRIHPYTDLLLHDMGEFLADGRADYQANGREWRTPPLWGVGLFDKTNGTSYYLHDGRARTLEEAILWHGGEAQDAREQFLKLSKSDRDAIISFLKSL